MDKKNSTKRIILFAALIAVICIGFVVLIKHNSVAEAQDSIPAAGDSPELTLQIDNPVMTVNGKETNIDENGTVPVIIDGRTLLPVRAVIESVGGTIQWDGTQRTTTITYNDNTIKLTIDSTTAYLNDNEQTLDTAPVIINDRTMLPIRFIAESLGFAVDWNADTRTVTISISAAGETSSEQAAENESEPAAQAQNENAPVVYMTKNITPEALVAIYDKLGFDASGKVAVKISTGEPPASNYLRPELIKDLVQKVNGTIVECNTAYGGDRASTAAHMQVAKDHGFTDIAEVDIMDADDSLEIPAVKGTTIKNDYVGSHLENYDSLISLAHFKGHAMAGFGGAIKNMSIGVASSKGKAWIHSGGTSTTNAWGGDQDKFLEAMGDATSGVIDYMDGKVVYINVMNRLSVDCDCNGNPAEPDIHDIGILASADPVALDQACVDLIYEQKDGDGASLVERIESKNGLHTLEHAEQIGLGSREYKLESID